MSQNVISFGAKYPELQLYLQTANNNTKIIKQILDSQLILKNNFYRKDNFSMESIEGGPKSIIKGTIKNLSHILNEVEIKATVRSTIADSD